MKNFNITNFVDSWALAKKSFLFFSKNKDLNIFPLFSVLITTLLCFSLFLLFPQEEWVLNNLFGFSLVASCAYFLFSFATTYLDMALMTIVLKRLTHEPASLRQGFQSANQQLFAIFKWALFISTVGWVLKLVENIQNIAKKLFGYSIGFSWSIAAYFVLPILITEKVGPFKAMQRSLETVGRGYKNTVSVKALITIIFIFIFFIISEFITAYPVQTTNLLITLLPVFLIAYFMAEALETILVSALFLNIVRLGSPKNFDPTMLARAFEKED